MGQGQFKYLFGNTRYSMNVRDAVKLCELIDPDVIVPVQYDGWTHFGEPLEQMKKRFERSKFANRVKILEKGKEYEMN